ncbi:GrpB family protein [Pseudonocardia sp. CA-107938]|uniref:GrpB family protein n=1 Tax=Pseudonocardia sp. CA-107938 TaxID=3240021 RepID=UPI003D933B44
MPVHPLWRPYELPDDEEIARTRVRPHVPAPIEVVAPDPGWPAAFDRVRARIAAALGAVALEIEHVGSTSVPGLWAKPVIDVDLVVPDSSDEQAYVPALEAAGFELRGRDPEWEEHRFFRGSEPAANVHVFSPGARESQRQRRFRDWLITHADDRTAYGELKRSVARRGFTDVMHYNNAKAWLIYDIYERIFAADPDAAHDPQPRP